MLCDRHFGAVLLEQVRAQAFGVAGAHGKGRHLRKAAVGGDGVQAIACRHSAQGRHRLFMATHAPVRPVTAGLEFDCRRH